MPMVNNLLGFVALCCAMWIAIATVDTIVAMVRREWRFSIRGAMLLTAVIAVFLCVLVRLK